MKKTTVNAMDVINSSPIFEKENLEDTEAFAVEDRSYEEILAIATKDFLKKISTRKGFKPDSTAFRALKAKAYSD